jgi:hypothetical protein
MRSLLALLLCCALVVTASCASGEPVAQPTTEPPQTFEPAPEPEPEPDPEATPFRVALLGVRALTSSNAAMYGRTTVPADEATADKAARDVTEVLQTYLDAQFRAPDTRLSAAPLEGLLTPRALSSLDEASRQALGEVDLPVTWTVTGPANALARVLFAGDKVISVAVQYDARLWAAFEEGRDAPLTMMSQRGSLLFTWTPEGWRADAVDLLLDAPEDLVADVGSRT